jgi:hypothetical protein
MLSLALVLLTFVPSETPADAKATLDFVRSLRVEGGFRVSESVKEPTLRATTAAVRCFKYFGGEIPENIASGAAAFLRTCHDPASGGFADTPGGKADAIATAVGLMLAGELGLKQEPFVDPAAAYLSERAKAYEEIRLAAGGLASVGRTTPKAADWLAELAKSRRADGTYGEETSRVRATGGTAALILRLGGELPERDAVMQLLRNGQGPDGGYPRATGERSDLETTYRVVRALHMLQAKPADEAGLRRFVRSCRQADGGYGVVPLQKSSVAGSYFAGIILHWLEQK